MLMQIISKHSAEISRMQYIKLQIAMKYVSFLKVISLEIAENIFTKNFYHMNFG